jgi:DNA-binding NarL/FixJ family response regulator
VRIAVVEPVALRREVLEWHIRQLVQDGHDGFELVSAVSEADLVLTWTRETSDANTAVRVVSVAAEGQKPMTSGKDLLPLLLSSAPLKRAWQQPAITPDKPPRQELVVLNAIAAGMTSTEIAAQLGISRHTVDGHRRRLFRRWGVHSSLEAVQLAKKHGFLLSKRPLA